MVGRAVLEPQSHEAPKGEAVAERFFHLRVREAVPLLQQQHLDHQQRRIAGAAFARGVDAGHDLPEPRPINGLGDPLQARILAQRLADEPFRQRRLAHVSRHSTCSPRSGWQRVIFRPVPGVMQRSPLRGKVRMAGRRPMGGRRPPSQMERSDGRACLPRSPQSRGLFLDLP